MKIITILSSAPSEVNSLFRGYGVPMQWLDTNRFATSNSAALKEAKHLLRQNGIKFI